MEVRLRNYILLHFAFRRRLIRSLVLCLFLASIGFVAVIGNDYASAIGGGNPALSGGRRVVGALNASRNPISACQVWFNLDDEDDLSRFDALRSCSIESALLRVNIDAAVCLLTDRIEQRKRRKNAKRIESTEWFKQLKMLKTAKSDSSSYGHLRHFSPSYSSVFAGTILEPLYVNSDDFAFLRPVVSWALLWKYGGLTLDTGVLVAVDSLESYTNFVWFDPTINEISMAIFQQKRHDLIYRVLQNFFNQANTQLDGVAARDEGGRRRRRRQRAKEGPTLFDIELSLASTEWTAELENYCGLPITETLDHRMCHDVEILGSSSVATATTVKLESRGGLTPSSYALMAVLVDEATRKNVSRSNRLDTLGPLGLANTVCPETAKRMTQMTTTASRQEK